MLQSTHVRSLDDLMAMARARGMVTVAVACGEDASAIEALQAAEAAGLARGILVGDAEKIAAVMGDHPLAEARVEPVTDPRMAVQRAVDLVREGQADILLKGAAQTATLMRAVLSRETGLRRGRLLSDCFLFEHDGRLLCITDGGINVSPDLDAKRQILLNAVELYHALGVPCPKVAVLSAVETVIVDHAPSQDAVELVRLHKAGELPGCIVEGPLSLDLAVNPEAYRKKGVESAVAGQADILLCPDIVSGNLLAKSTTQFARARLAHVIMGAKAPILIPSRSDAPEAKLLSVALGAMVRNQ